MPFFDPVGTAQLKMRLLGMNTSPFGNLLYSNDPPKSRSEETEIAAFSTKLEAEAEQLREAVASSNSLLAKTRLHHLERFIEAHKRALHPIRKLPPEVLQRIFVACQPFSRCGEPDHMTHSKEAPLVADVSATTFRFKQPAVQPATLAQVCKGWRETTLANPMLWSTIDILFQYPRPSRTAVQRLKDLLARSGNSSLTIRLDLSMVVGTETGRSPLKPAEPFVSLLLQHAERWGHVTILGASCTALGAFSGAAGRLSALRSLYIRFCRFEIPAGESLSLFSVAPTLESVAIISKEAVRIDLPLAQLTSYTLCDERSTVPVFGRDTASAQVVNPQRLTTLHIRLNNASQNIQETVFPCLTTFGLEIGNLISDEANDVLRTALTNTKAPNLRSLCVQSPRSRRQEVVDAVTSFILGHGGLHLEDLKVEGTSNVSRHHDVSIRDLLLAIPSVRYLRIPLSRPEDLELLIANEANVCNLGILLPSLLRLEIDMGDSSPYGQPSTPVIRQICQTRCGTRDFPPAWPTNVNVPELEYMESVELLYSSGIRGDTYCALEDWTVPQQHTKWYLSKVSNVTMWCLILDMGSPGFIPMTLHGLQGLRDMSALYDWMRYCKGMPSQDEGIKYFLAVSPHGNLPVLFNHIVGYSTIFRLQGIDDLIKRFAKETTDYLLDTIEYRYWFPSPRNHDGVMYLPKGSPARVFDHDEVRRALEKEGNLDPRLFGAFKPIHRELVEFSLDA